MKAKTVSADDKGRITLGGDYAGRQFTVRKQDDGTVLLEPSVTVTVPEREAWIFANQEALQSLKRGIQQARDGKTKSLGSFAEHADSE
jgi:hypothetical protein